MECIRVYGYEEDSGAFVVSRMTYESGNKNNLTIDWPNVLMQIFRLPRGYRNLYVIEGIVSVMQGHLNVSE